MKNLFVYSSFLLLIALVFVSCQKKDYSTEVNHLLIKYLAAWNEGNLEILDEITPLDFELRMIPDFEAKGSRDLLKEEIANTRIFSEYLSTFMPTKSRSICRASRDR